MSFQEILDRLEAIEIQLKPEIEALEEVTDLSVFLENQKLLAKQIQEHLIVFTKKETIDSIDTDDILRLTEALKNVLGASEDTYNTFGE